MKPAAMAGALLALVLVVHGEKCRADEAPRPIDVSALLPPILAEHDIPGMVVAVVTSRGPEGYGHAGVRRRGAGTQVTLEDKFHLGSCTKSMTASLCALLVERHRLRWDLSLEQAFPQLAPKMDPGYRSVTLEQLLRNHGGFPHEIEPELWHRLRDNDSERASRHQLLEGIVAHPPPHAPGTEFVYSNAGFAVAGHAAERVLDRDYESLMRELLFEPLDIHSAGFGSPGTPDTLDQPRGHDASGEPVEPGPAADNPVAIAPAGRVHMNIADWGKYISWHLRGARGGTKLLSKRGFARLHEPFGESTYAMGWVTGTRPWAGTAGKPGPVLSHSGSNTMWYCVAWLAPERDFAVLIACNQGGKRAAQACDAAAGALILALETSGF